MAHHTIALARAVELFLKEHIKTSMRSYRGTLIPMMNFIGPARPLTSVRADTLLEYGQSLRERNLAPATINTHVTHMRVFFNWCLKVGWIDEPPPSAALKLVPKAKPIDRHKAMPDEDYLRLLDYAKWQPRAYALVLFLGDTACRRRGAAGLKWSEIDFDNNIAVVTEKKDKTRPVFFEKECAAALKRWKLEQGDGEYVFSKSGEQVQPAAISDYLATISEKAGLSKAWRSHSLRHRKGFQFYEARIAASVAARAMGHENVMITLSYYYPDDLSTVRAAMEELAYKPPQKEEEKPAKIINFKRDNA